jgi:hypothetical protein
MHHTIIINKFTLPDETWRHYLYLKVDSDIKITKTNTHEGLPHMLYLRFKNIFGTCTSIIMRAGKGRGGGG